MKKLQKMCKYCESKASKRHMCEKHYRKWWRSKNKERDKLYNKKYYEENVKQKRKWKQKNKICEHCKKEYKPTGKNQKYCNKTCHNTAACRKKLDTNLQYKIRHNLRSRLRKALKGQEKGISTIKLLGCSIEDLEIHLESQFKPGMTWDNYGRNGWHIDHIKPLANFNLINKNQIKKACHYTNLQPLWASENIIKSNKIL